MADKMTLEQLSSSMHEQITDNLRLSPVIVAQWVACLDAHIAAMGEPVAWDVLNADGSLCAEHVIKSYAEGLIADHHNDATSMRALYLTSPSSGDWEKVREVVIDLRRDSALLARNLTSENDLLDMADKLTAALPENGNG